MEIVDGKAYINQVRNLIIEYTQRLNRDLSFQNIEDELKDPAQKYTPPRGEILVAINEENEVMGMIAYHRHNQQRCEMKRLYVRPQYRGQKIGRHLIEEILNHAKQAGYQEMVLDTIVPLKAAIDLYYQFGFQKCIPYYDNPMNDVIYMKKNL